MTKVTWINPAEADHTTHKSGFKISHSANTDRYGNHCRDWRAEKVHPTYTDRIVIASGSGGVSICVQGINNGFVHLNKDLVNALVKELGGSIKYSQTWGKRFRDYWRGKNALYEKLKSWV